MLGFESNYEVCNCKNVTVNDIITVFKNDNTVTLRDIQDITTAGTECRHCIFAEADFGKIKKKIYCKDILSELKKEIKNG